MGKKTVIFALAAGMLAACSEQAKTPAQDTNKTMAVKQEKHMKNGYADINGINMYYEIYGEGKPLVLLHGGGSTIQTSFGRIIPLFSAGRQLICVELQAHGRTGDRDTPLSFTQDADDVAALLKTLHVEKADIFGFSNGGNTALQMAIRHPQLCRKIVAASVLLKRDGTFPGFWKFMETGTFAQMPEQYKTAFMDVTPDSAKLKNMYQKCADRMINFADFTDAEIQSIRVPVLLVNGDRDVASNEHIVAMGKLIEDSRLAIIPGGHGEYMGEITTLKPGTKSDAFIVPLIEAFLDEEEPVKAE